MNFNGDVEDAGEDHVLGEGEGEELGVELGEDLGLKEEVRDPRG